MRHCILLPLAALLTLTPGLFAAPPPGAGVEIREPRSNESAFGVLREVLHDSGTQELVKGEGEGSKNRFERIDHQERNDRGPGPA